MKKIKKKKRKFNPKKFIKNWSIILGVIFVIVMLTSKKEDNKTEKQTQETVATAEDNNNNVLTVELENPEVNNQNADWNLILVNKDHKIPEDYKVELQSVETKHKVDSRIVESLEKMLEDARKQGLKPLICSSYRTTEAQTMLFQQKRNQFMKLGSNQEEAEEKASYWVTLPRTSEHEIGLAVDIVSLDYQVLDQKQESTPLQKWLIEHCAEYGFILRYPTHKNEITKVNYEPWHYRYVGVEVAREIQEKGICLEEYLNIM